MEKENVLVSASRIHFSTKIRKDATLFRAYYLVNQEGINYQLEKIGQEIVEAKKDRDKKQYALLKEQRLLLEDIKSDIDFGLDHVKDEVLAGMDKAWQQSTQFFAVINANIDELYELGQSTLAELYELKNIAARIDDKIDNVGSQIDNVGSQIEQSLGNQNDILAVVEQIQKQIVGIKEIHFMEKKARLSDSFSIRPREKIMVRQLLTKWRDLPAEVKNKADELNIEIGTLLSATGENKEANEILLQVETNGLSKKNKALASFNRFINFVATESMDEAFDAYQQAIELDPSLELFVDYKFKAEKLLGAGGFGIVFLCNSDVWEKVVVKALCRGNIEMDFSKVMAEAKNLAKVRSPYIIKLKDFGYTNWAKHENPYIAMEYFAGSNLEEYIEKNGAFVLNRGIEVAQAIAKGLQAAHGAGVIHRDLKPANILYKAGSEEEKFALKIIDFGLAVRGAQLKEMAQSIRSSNNRSIIESSIAGTMRYAPPEQMGELIEGKEWAVKEYSDIFAYGRTLKMIFFGKLKPHYKEMRNFANHTLLELIDDCEMETPSDRPQNFAEILSVLEQTQIWTYPKEKNITLGQAIDKIAKEVRAGLEIEDLFEIEYDYDNNIAANKIKTIKQQGKLSNKKVQNKALVVLSKGVERIKFPQDINSPWQELKQYQTYGTREEAIEEIKKYHDYIAKGQIIKILSTGIIENGCIKERARLEISAGKAPEYSFPSKTGISIDQGRREIYDYVENKLQLDQAFDIQSSEYSDDYQADSISKINKYGRLKAGQIITPAIVILSKGKNPVQQIQGFSYSGENSYSCANNSYTVKEYRHEQTEMEFVLIPAGTFMMGSNYEVELSSYLIAKYQCTQAQWQSVMGNNPSYNKGNNLPVEQISWDNCQDFCKKTGLKLPTEAQWEYACRGGCVDEYCFGNDESLLKNYAWYDENSNGETHAVGKKQANAYGLYDMHGNVWEWCQDWHGDYPSEKTKDPVRASNGSLRVGRGGSCWYNSGSCGSADRYCSSPVGSSVNLGVRFASVLNF